MPFDAPRPELREILGYFHTGCGGSRSPFARAEPAKGSDA
jgi:hypothetical protein